jgi:hypothetical protein
MRSIICFILFFFSLTTLYSCNSGNNNNQLSITADQNLAVNIKRLDIDLYNYLQSPSKDFGDSLRLKYGDLLNAFGTNTINHSEINEDFFLSIQNYFSNASLLQIYKDELNTFKNIKDYEEQLSKVTTSIRENFEGKTLPVLAMHVSGFKENVIVTNDIISISADKYLGVDYPIYKDFFEVYQRIQMQPQMIVRDYLKAWLISEIIQSGEKKNLLSEMINEGKILYVLDTLLPDWKDTDLIGYTSEQLNWCNTNEKLIWDNTVQKKYLYSNDFQLIGKYTNEAPYTAPISTESPGRLGAWIGWQIIKAYAKNTGGTLDQICKEKDIQKILKLSKYKP